MKPINILYDKFQNAYLFSGSIHISNNIKSNNTICTIGYKCNTMIVTPNNFHQFVDEDYYYELLYFYCHA